MRYPRQHGILNLVHRYRMYFARSEKICVCSYLKSQITCKVKSSGCFADLSIANKQQTRNIRNSSDSINSFVLSPRYPKEFIQSGISLTARLYKYLRYEIAQSIEQNL